MSPVLPSLLPEPLRIAHRGASGIAAPDTAEAFRLALRLGATALAGDLRSTADGVAVVHGDARTGRLRRSRIGAVRRSELPSAILGVDELAGLAGIGVPLFLDVHDPAAVDDAVARSASRDVELWLCSGDLVALSAWRSRHPGVRTVWTAVLRRLPEGPERAVARLREAGVDALRLRHDEWSGGLTALVHRFGRLAFAGEVDHTRVAMALVRMGIDAMWSAHPDRLGDAVAGRSGGPGPGST